MTSVCLSVCQSACMFAYANKTYQCSDAETPTASISSVKTPQTLAVVIRKSVPVGRCNRKAGASLRRRASFVLSRRRHKIEYGKDRRKESRRWTPRAASISMYIDSGIPRPTELSIVSAAVTFTLGLPHHQQVSSSSSSGGSIATDNDSFVTSIALLACQRAPP